MPIFWRIIQYCSILASLLLLVFLFVRPDYTIALFWNAIIPLLPASFLISPLIWRRICPLATVNMFTGNKSTGRSLSPESIRHASLFSVSLFALLVPARLFLFNHNAMILAIFILIVLSGAFLLGTQYRLRSGFCNSICPVLPVEKLYGSSPLITIEDKRCATCSLCTARGCIDVSPSKSIIKTMGKAHKSPKWMFTPIGIFALSLPGFIYGYFNAAEVPLQEAGYVYLQIGFWVLVSYLALSTLSSLFRLSASTSLPILGVVALSLYYWFVAPKMADFWGYSSLTNYIRIAAILLILVWSLNYMKRQFHPLRQRKSNYRIA